jgi:hypothetical protein
VDLATVKGFFRDNPALLLTGAYVYASVIGVLSSVVLLNAFHIPALYFTSSTDLLFAALRDWLSLLFGVLPFAFLWVGTAIIRVLGAESPLFAQRYLIAATLFLALVLVPSFVTFNALLVANDIRTNKRSASDVVVDYEGARLPPSNVASLVTQRLHLIHANGSFLFVWNPTAKCALILPTSKIIAVRPSD